MISIKPFTLWLSTSFWHISILFILFITTSSICSKFLFLLTTFFFKLFWPHWQFVFGWICHSYGKISTISVCLLLTWKSNCSTLISRNRRKARNSSLKLHCWSCILRKLRDSWKISIQNSKMSRMKKWKSSSPIHSYLKSEYPIRAQNYNNARNGSKTWRNKRKMTLSLIPMKTFWSTKAFLPKSIFLF